MKVVVYGRNTCVQCHYTTKELDKLGVAYEYVDVDNDPDARRDVEKMGYSTLPVVVVSGQGEPSKWAGFKVDMLRKLSKSAVVLATAMLLAVTSASAPARAMPLNQVITTVKDAHGHYKRGGASLAASDCSGLASVVQSLAMGVPIQRFGNTISLLNGKWPHAIPGAKRSDAIVFGVNRAHMTVSVNGYNIESGGGPYRFGDAASSPWDPKYTKRFHVDPAVIKS